MDHKLNKRNLIVLLIVWASLFSIIAFLPSPVASQRTFGTQQANVTLPVLAKPLTVQQFFEWFKFRWLFNALQKESQQLALIHNTIISVTSVKAEKFQLDLAPEQFHPDSVSILFTQSGLGSDVTGGTNVFNIDSVNYTKSQLPYTFTWNFGDTHAVIAISPIAGVTTGEYQFSSWTNGDGLSGATGTYTVPISGVTVTANYLVHTLGITSQGTTSYPRAKSVTNSGTPVYIDMMSSSGKFVAASSQSLSAVDSADWFFSTGAFTIDLWTYFNTLPTAGNSMTLLSQYQDGNNFWRFFVDNSSGTYRLQLTQYAASSYTVSLYANTSPNLSTSVWYHFAVVRNSNSWYLFQGGTQISSTYTNSASMIDLSAVLSVDQFGGGSYLNGWDDEVRVSKGIARWTSNFTPPTTAYTTQGNIDSYTVLLLEFAGLNASTTSFGDSSPSRKVITNVNGVTIDTGTYKFSKAKFGGSEVYVPALSYAQVAASNDWGFGTGAFTISAWITFSAFPASGISWNMITYSTVTGSNYWTWYVNNNVGVMRLAFANDTAGVLTACTVNTSPNLVLGVNYFLAVDRNSAGNQIMLFQDGTQIGSTCSQTYTVGVYGGPVYIGNATLGFSGWVDDAAINKGTQDYTTTFTDPVNARVREPTDALDMHFDGPLNATSGVGFADDVQSGQVFYTKATLTDANAMVQSVSFLAMAGTSGQWQASIYSDSSGPSARQVYCPTQTISGALTVQTVLISSCTPTSLVLTSGGSTAFWIAVQVDFTATTITSYTLELSWAAGSSNTGAYQFQAYGTPPSTASATLSTENYTVYATYLIGQNITFTQSGLGSDVSGGITVLTIDSVTYSKSSLPTVFVYSRNSTHSVVASTPITGSTSSYNWSSWTNGDGLSGSSGTYTVPTSDITVTATYISCAVVTTAFTGGSSGADISGGTTVLTIDSVAKTESQMPVTECAWTYLSTHTIVSVATLTGSTYIYDWSSWTNPDGLPNAYTGGTYTVPSPALTVTANFTARPLITWKDSFEAGGADVSGSQVVLTIDSVDYTKTQLNSTGYSFNSWTAGSTHSVVATSPITGSTLIYVWGSWTNGDGLSSASGTYTTPGTDTIVTVNYLELKHGITFGVNGLGSDFLPGTEVLIIDSTAYYVGSGSPSLNVPVTFTWAVGSSHTIQNINCFNGYGDSTGCIVGTSGNTYTWSNWVNASSGGMVDATNCYQSPYCTYIVPNSDQIVISSYGPVPTVTFQASGIGGDVSGSTLTLTIDGTNYLVSDFPEVFSWSSQSIHYVSAQNLLSGSTHSYFWLSWTNAGQYLTLSPSGTYIVPTWNQSNLTGQIVTVNYGLDPLITFRYTFDYGAIVGISSTLLLTIDSTPYTKLNFDNNVSPCSIASPPYTCDLGVSFNWTASSTHSVVVNSPFLGPTGSSYVFSSWTNGDGVSGLSGTYTVPSTTQVVTVNYVTPLGYSWYSQFAGGGADLTSTALALTIDGTGYTVAQAENGVTFTSIQWSKGSNHTVVAVASITGSSYTYNWAGWQNGGTLTGASGTYVAPSPGVAIQAQYAISTTVTITFTQSGLGSDVTGATIVLSIDGVTKTKTQLASLTFTWTIGSVHSISAVTTITGSTYTYYFATWVNAGNINGTLSQGSYYTPAVSSTVTVDYTTQNTVVIIWTEAGLGSDVAGGTLVLMIDSVVYSKSQLTSLTELVQLWTVGSTHQISLLEPISGTQYVYYWTAWNWTGTGGLSNPTTDAAQTFTVPSTTETVTAVFSTTTITTVIFAQVGLGSDVVSGTVILQVDGVAYTKATLPTKNWLIGSVHTINAAPNILEYQFYDWTGATDGLSAAIGPSAANGSYTTPSGGGSVTLTANYSTIYTSNTNNFVHITFTENGVGPDVPACPENGSICANQQIYNIDGQIYYVNELPVVQNWQVGSTHSVAAFFFVQGTTYNYYWKSWTNGDGLPPISGTYTTPATATTVIANYSISNSDYNIFLTPNSTTLQSGGASITVTVNIVNAGGNPTVSLACTGTLPTGVTCSFNPTSGSATYTSTLTITTTSGTPNGANSILVTGTGGAGGPRSALFVLFIGTFTSVCPGACTQKPVYIQQVVTVTPLFTSSTTIQSTHTALAGGVAATNQYNFWYAIILLIIPFIVFTAIGYEAAGDTSGSLIGMMIGAGIGLTINVYLLYIPSWTILLAVIGLAIAIGARVAGKR